MSLKTVFCLIKGIKLGYKILSRILSIEGNELLYNYICFVLFEWTRCALSSLPSVNEYFSVLIVFVKYIALLKHDRFLRCMSKLNDSSYGYYSMQTQKPF